MAKKRAQEVASEKMVYAAQHHFIVSGRKDIPLPMIQAALNAALAVK